MGRHTWGRAAAGIAPAAAVISTASGCGGDADVDKGQAKKPAAAAPSFVKASKAFQDKVDSDSCQSMEPDSCWGEMTALIKPARTLRHSLNSEKSVSADFWTEAYSMIDTMEEAMTEGSDLGARKRARAWITLRFARTVTRCLAALTISPIGSTSTPSRSAQLNRLAGDRTATCGPLWRYPTSMSAGQCRSTPSTSQRAAA
ncbi:hypothetical protein [Streptomyces sp. NPDC127066]|uniref:hypothetical protein n=1 Tax=Streptomyces sp. NPDC127066 TaxID=3347125 RepID=UPI00364D050A